MKNIILICKSVLYHSILDETAFFEWINKIPSIVNVDGSGDELYLYIKRRSISDKDLRELIGLFYRYKVDMKQLQIFLNERNKEWFFGKPKGYWHTEIFGSSKN